MSTLGVFRLPPTDAGLTDLGVAASLAGVPTKEATFCVPPSAPFCGLHWTGRAEALCGVTEGTRQGRVHSQVARLCFHTHASDLPPQGVRKWFFYPLHFIYSCAEREVKEYCFDK